MELAGSMSSSGVYRVRFDGGDAVLKVTMSGPDQDNARRELAFYCELAHRIPVRTPRLLQSVDNDELTALLLAAHAPAPSARHWRHSAWLEVARQLAALHSVPSPAGEPWVRTPWLEQVLAHPPTTITEDFWSRTEAADHIDGVIATSAALGEAVNTVPEGFVHGDCHVDNFLCDGGDLIWADWQGAGTGRPTGDLAFLWGRAHSDGADPPRDAMLEEYARHREMDPRSFRESLVATELATFLFCWPEYAGYHTDKDQSRVTRRLIHLIGDWHKLRS